jgi:Tfp pilus assembly protein PilF
MRLGVVVSSISLMVSVACIAGCGPSQMKATDIAASTQASDDALAKLNAKDYAGAKVAAAAALKSGGLSADQASEMILVLVEAAIGAGELDAAESKLTEAESSANDMARVFVLRGLLERKRGDQAKAQAAFDQARSLDPSVRIPD